jgi:hypothetical protein
VPIPLTTRISEWDGIKKWRNEIHGTRVNRARTRKANKGGPGEHEETEETDPTRACGGAALVPATAMIGGGRAADSHPASCSSSSSSSSSPSGPSTGGSRLHRSKRRPDILNMLMVTKRSLSLLFLLRLRRRQARLGLLLQSSRCEATTFNVPAVTVRSCC